MIDRWFYKLSLPRNVQFSETALVWPSLALNLEASNKVITDWTGDAASEGITTMKTCRRLLSPKYESSFV